MKNQVFTLFEKKGRKDENPPTQRDVNITLDLWFSLPNYSIDH